MADKTIAFNIDITGVSNESQELAKIEYQLRNIKKEKSELDKLNAKGFLSTEDRAKVAAYSKEIEIQTQRQKELRKVMDSAPDSLNRMRADLIKLKTTYANTSAEIREKMAPAILKLNNEISKAEQSIGVHQRNVGNYPKLANEASNGFNQLTSAVGGTTGEIGNAITSFTTAGGAAGIFTAVIGTLAAAWKRVQENIELYLTSADKLKFGFAGYEKDVEKAQLDARRRASGQIATGRTSLTEANRIIDFAGSTAEQREQAKLMAEQAKLMIAEGQAFRDQVVGIKDKITWTLKYNKLLQEDEAITDEKLAKEIEWEALEANLIKQRAIVSDQESTSAQKKQAALDADIIANKLVKDKTAFIDKQLVNIQSIADMTFTQEVVEDKVNGLLKERNTIQKEYYADQVKINRLTKTASKDLEDEIKMTKAESDRIAKQNQLSDLKMKITPQNGPLFSLTGVSVTTKKKVKEDVDDIGNIIDKANDQQISDAIDLADRKLKIEEDFAERKLNIIKGASILINSFQSKNTALQKTQLIAERSFAIAEIVIRTKTANSILRSNALASVLPGPGYLLRLAAAQALISAPIALNNISAALNIAAIIAATITGFAKGGKINRGIPINTGSVDDTLIAVNKTETVLTQSHVSKLGGSGMMRKIGVPGYAMGGYIGQQAPEIPSQGMDFQSMVNAIKAIQIRLDVNKVNSAQREIEVITETQRI